MPKKNPEHDARLEIRLSKNMLRALKVTAEVDRLPLSDWVRNTLNENCFSARNDEGFYWLGKRRDGSFEYRSYTDMDGNITTDPEPYEKIAQDIQMDRDSARKELRFWKHKWGRSLKTNVLTKQQTNMLDRLLATFDK